MIKSYHFQIKACAAIIVYVTMERLLDFFKMFDIHMFSYITHRLSHSLKLTWKLIVLQIELIAYEIHPILSFLINQTRLILRYLNPKAYLIQNYHLPKHMMV